ncbi:MAG: hypothetical protein E7381_05835 [Clostridiales bacterium]|nr:hypothetical protein [Clostridiales bacterium]
MGQNYKTYYKRKFYSRKITGIFLHALILAVSLFLLIGFLSAGSVYDAETASFLSFLIFAFFATIYLFSLAWINNVRIARLHDDVVGNRYPERKPREDFWSEFFSKSLWAIILLEIFLLIVLYILIDAGAPETVYIALVACMIGTLVIKLRYNAKVRDIRLTAETLTKTGKEYAINYAKEKRNILIVTVVWVLALIILTVYFYSNREGYIGNWAPLVFVVIGVVALFPQIQSINSAREEEELQVWLKKKEAEKKAEEKNKASDEPVDEPTFEHELAQQFSDIEQPNYKTVQSFSHLCEDFCDFAQKNGVLVELTSAKDIFAGMFASRAVWLRCDNTAYAYRVAETVRKYFLGNRSTVTLRTNVYGGSSLFQSDEEDKNSEPLLKQLYTANKLSNSVHVFVFKNVEQTDFKRVFAPFINAFCAPEDDNKIRVDEATGYHRDSAPELNIPANVWGFFVIGAKNKSNLVNREYASEVLLRCVEEPRDVAVYALQDAYLSYARFLELASECMQEHFLALDTWKKIDAIEEYLQGQIPFALSNPMARQIEQYSSALLAGGVDEQEVVDKVLETRIVPLLSGYKKERIDAEGNTLTQILDNLFGMDNLPRTQKALTDRNLF